MELCGKEVKLYCQVENCILLAVEVADHLVDTQQAIKPLLAVFFF